MNNSQQLNEDQKKYRKLRKVLRQIEHLHLLNRELNKDEKQKVKEKIKFFFNRKVLTRFLTQRFPKEVFIESS